ncbi:hypothetical protein MNEG_4138 [Monoraphidium neglectum]|uniref:Uncharacterized protein n=1 Tax=Monoraphidium neglectum TaxID=145388 RepID=A0A0D2MLU5_9CHLO|nr:hypothetical protein MNEG_4138 [Monoraphidium neglectum]KIZ03825.1 hypothetical protein MNEG_4138 [Monoraphidium neglectum]|eukprot:XP_013902844.1 hypothetical protein MNEG_4138 [Monoraphidium neglectum]
MGTDLETRERTHVPDGFWRGVAAQLRLTAEQREDVRAMDALYKAQIGGVMEERAQLQAQLAGMAADDSAASFLSRGLLYALVFEQLFTPLQMARAAVYSWPFIADAHHIVKAICSLEPTQPEAAGLAGPAGGGS